MTTLSLSSVCDKLEALARSAESALAKELLSIPLEPGRDLPILPPEFHPDKKGLSYREGQARLLHDLANIELQATELALRTLIEFPDAPEEFREELYRITLSEGSHLQLCLNGLEKLGHRWGEWPVHLGLWSAVGAEDSLLDRILIVHRYLEGSGLDAGETLLQRLSGVAESAVHPVVKTIVTEEVAHVEFGSRWYREICRREKLDPNDDFVPRMDRIFHKVPRRIEKISHRYRLQAGFTEGEITYLEKAREQALKDGLLRAQAKRDRAPRA